MPVGLRPVTQQQLEARSVKRQAAAATATAVAAPLKPAGAARRAIPEPARVVDARGDNGRHALSNDSDDDDGGWKSVESRSRWHRTNKHRAPSTTALATALLEPPKRASLSTSSSYQYAWATTSVTSASAASATANGSTSSSRVTYSQREEPAATRRSQLPASSNSALPLRTSSAGSIDTSSMRRTSGTPRGTTRSSINSINSNSLSRTTSMRSPPLGPAPPSDARVRRSTSLQQLLTQIESTLDSDQQQQPVTRRRNDVQSPRDPQLLERRSCADTSGTKQQSLILNAPLLQPPLPPGPPPPPPPQQPLKCGDKRDFFFRNLDFETRNRLQIDDVAGFSVTEHEMATRISEAIVALFDTDVDTDTNASRENVVVPNVSAPETNFELSANSAVLVPQLLGPPMVPSVPAPKPRKRSALTITDATACIGGNVISFCDFFAIVNAVECDGTRCAMLEHNLLVLRKHNAMCIHASYLLVMHDLQQDVVFIDPPWGGPEYKDREKVDLFLDDVPLDAIVSRLFGSTAVVVLKVPTNFDADKFAARVPGRVSVRTDLNKMHLVTIDFREEQQQVAVSASEDASSTSVASLSIT